MSYTTSLQCGCTVYVACWPQTGVAHTTILELRGEHCKVRGHERGTKLWAAPRGAAAPSVGSWNATPLSAEEDLRPRQIA